MSTSTHRDPNLTGSEAPPPLRHRARTTRRPSVAPQIATPSDTEEASFWARLEEREHGRLTQEADHLFDTSYAWAA
ncbi:MAG: hypothetical protein HGA45_28335 [Chloroflexales bacterium]|nr:hypothetical protein [Chloroflexales bacterium]